MLRAAQFNEAVATAPARFHLNAWSQRVALLSAHG